jgi:hypothetical protein
MKDKREREKFDKYNNSTTNHNQKQAKKKKDREKRKTEIREKISEIS